MRCSCMHGDSRSATAIIIPNPLLYQAAVCSCVWVILETMALGDLDVQVRPAPGRCDFV
jgi:hypothetical protein